MYTASLTVSHLAEYQNHHLHENSHLTIAVVSSEGVSGETKVESEFSARQQLMQSMLEQSRRITEVTREFPVHHLDCGGIAVRQLGPVAIWGGELIVRSKTIEDLRELIKAVSAEMLVKISGFIFELNDGALVFHMSRWPRRVGVPVPSILESKQILDRLIATAEHFSFEAVIKEDACGAPHARALLGLEEGYFDGRRKNIIYNWDTVQDKSLESLIRALSNEIGDLKQFGIDIHTFDTADELIECLRSTTFTTCHTVEEVTRRIGSSSSSSITFTPAYIYSIDQAKNYCYEEPAVIVEGPNSECFFAAVVKAGHAMHQARFSYEDLSCGAAWNVEILDCCENAAAGLR